MVLVLPIRIVVGMGLALVTPGDHDEATVFTSDRLERRPDSDDGIRGAEGKVDEILMQRVPPIDVGRLVEIHAVHGNEVAPDQLFHLVQQGDAGRVLAQDGIGLDKVHLADAVSLGLRRDQALRHLGSSSTLGSQRGRQ